ncbi:MAG: DUF1835 domain-containing protein [Bacteroidota bacterium]
MSSIFHILNGDALLEQLPDSILGTRIVARECLIDGPTHGKDLTDFFHIRDAFLRKWEPEATGLLGAGQIHQDIQHIPADSEVNLWFEEDLFCQLNLWFVLYALAQLDLPMDLYLVLPRSDMRYGFGGLKPETLPFVLEKRQKITTQELHILRQLWPAYQSEEMETLQALATSLSSTYKFLLPAIEAHLARKPTDTYPGRPVATLQAIMDELDTDTFGPIFREFVQREPIYGFGDLQVHQMWQSLRKGS